MWTDVHLTAEKVLRNRWHHPPVGGPLRDATRVHQVVQTPSLLGTHRYDINTILISCNFTSCFCERCKFLGAESFQLCPLKRAPPTGIEVSYGSGQRFFGLVGLPPPVNTLMGVGKLGRL